MDVACDFVDLNPRADTHCISRGRTVLLTDRHGQVEPHTEQGLFVHQTRLLSKYRYRVDGRAPEAVALSPVQQHSWFGYYLTPSQPELKVARTIEGCLHEDLDFKNYTQKPVKFLFELELEADFADLDDVASGTFAREGPEHQRFSRVWRRRNQAWELVFSYQAEHHVHTQDVDFRAEVDRSLCVRLENFDSPPLFNRGVLSFEIELEPGQGWHTCVLLTPSIEDNSTDDRPQCHDFAHPSKPTRFGSRSSNHLTPVVLQALEQAERDLDALRLDDRPGHQGAVPAAGVPLYTALFGRDTLTAAWQAAMMTPVLMHGTLERLAELQGQKTVAWRDEAPGRMLHEAHTGPRSILGFTPRARYYGSLTTSSFFPVALAELWHWTGDREAVEAHLDSALRCLRWLDEEARHEDGFYYYDTVSEDGIKNQGWKDSDEAIVYPDGRLVPNPIAPCEEQGFVFGAKTMLAEVLWWLDRKDEARRLLQEAGELKHRFREVYWRDALQSYALALDPKGEPVDTLASNPGHLLATGIVERERAQAVADSLLGDEMFSGWGVRTLSCRHPAYNPYSYHNGSVWPVEQATFSLGFYRYGLHDHLKKLTRAQFEACRLLRFRRLPEVLSGHPRNPQHPFPAFYPRTNFPQAWSSSALFLHVQSLLGLYPYAPLNLLIVDPQLPEWLPELEVRDLRVGQASVTLRFTGSDYRVLDATGGLHVVRQPSPWSLTAGTGERLKDVLMSLLPGR